MIYLAIPYTGREEFSFSLTTAIAAELSARGEVVYSPITHSHPMTKVRELPGDWEFWGNIDREFIRACSKMYVICADGWAVSTGVQAEIKIAKRIDRDYAEFNTGIDVFYLDVKKLESGSISVSGLDIDEIVIDGSHLVR